MMHRKSLETILYSSAGIVVMLVIIVAVNIIIGAFPLRADLTQNKAYTLSAGTRTILKKLDKLDTPVKIRFYCSQGATATPESVYLKNYASQVQDLLREYQQVAGRHLVIQKLDPEPDTDAEDSARLDGLEPRQLSDDENFYLGLCVTFADQRVAIPFLAPNRGKLLEYDITRAISRVLEPEKPTIGIMSGLPVMGEQPNPQMMQMGQHGSAPWTFVKQLKQDYSVEKVPMDTDKIPDDVKTLVVVFPRGISDKAQYAIDQFVLRGGKLIAFLDPMSAYASRQQNPMMGGRGASASLPKLLKAWGIQFDTSKVVADLDFKMQLRNQNGQPEDAPAWLALTPEGINQKDIVTSEIDSLWLPMAGAFTGEPDAGLKETVLLHSSKDADLVNSFEANMGNAAMNGFTPTGVEYKLAVRLTGKFKTAFPDGNPEDAGKTNNVAKTNNSLKVSKVPTSVVLVGDSDLLADDFSLRKINSIFGQLISPMNANLDFAQNLVGEMAGDSALIGLRSRGSLSRPFTRVKAMEAAAEAHGQAKIDQLQKSLAQTQQRLNQLQAQKKNANQRYILSPEQQTEIKNFRKQEADVSRELREARKDLRREVVSMETKLEWINILAMPFAVTLAGMAIAFVKRKKTSAK